MSFLVEMSLPKKEILSKMNHKSEEYIIHLIMLICMPDDVNKNHWMKEIYGFYPRTYKCKGTDKNPTAEEIYASIFGYCKDTFLDNFASYIDEINVKEDKELNYKAFNSEDIRQYLHEYSIWLAINLSNDSIVTSSSVFGKLEDLLNTYNDIEIKTK